MYIFVELALHNSEWFKPFHAKWSYFYFHLLKVVSRYREIQIQVSKKYSYLFILRPNIYKFWCLNMQFIPNNSDFICL